MANFKRKKQKIQLDRCQYCHPHPKHGSAMRLEATKYQLKYYGYKQGMNV